MNQRKGPPVQSLDGNHRDRATLPVALFVTVVLPACKPSTREHQQSENKALFGEHTLPRGGGDCQGAMAGALDRHRSGNSEKFSYKKLFTGKQGRSDCTSFLWLHYDYKTDQQCWYVSTLDGSSDVSKTYSDLKDRLYDKRRDLFAAHDAKLNTETSFNNTARSFSEFDDHDTWQKWSNERSSKRQDLKRASAKVRTLTAEEKRLFEEVQPIEQKLFLESHSLTEQSISGRSLNKQLLKSRVWKEAVSKLNYKTRFDITAPSFVKWLEVVSGSALVIGGVGMIVVCAEICQPAIPFLALGVETAGEHTARSFFRGTRAPKPLQFHDVSIGLGGSEITHLLANILYIDHDLRKQPRRSGSVGCKTPIAIAEKYLRKGSVR